MFVKLPFYKLMEEETAAEGTPQGAEQPVGSETDSAATEVDEDIWGDMFEAEGADGLEEGSTGSEETPAKTPEEGKAEGEETPRAEPNAEEGGGGKEAPEEPTPEDTPTEENPQTQTPQNLTPEQQEAIQRELQKVRGQVESQLTQLYELEPEDAELFQMEPEKVLPKLAAKLHMNVLEAMHEGVRGMLPTMIQQVTQQQQAQEKYVGAFFEAWPALNDEKYMDTVVRVVENYKRSNPQAPVEQVINEAGAAAMIALRLPLEQQQQQQMQPVQQQQQVNNPPPSPAATGTSGGRSPEPVSDNIFERLSEEFLEEM